MDILPNEVKEVKTVGTLHGDDVKMVVTDGGFHVFVGKKKKTSKKSEALAASSHAALGMHQLGKEYGADFEPAIFKNEQDQLEKVEAKTEYLPSDMIAKGVELFTLSKGSKVDFVLVKHGITLGQYCGEIEDQSLVIKSGGFTHKDAINKNFKTAKAMARALKDKVHDLKLKGIKKAY
jgi:hypothetical protein